MQVVANPFIWSRLNRPGQPVPFLFDEFRPAERAAVAEAQPEGTAARLQTSTGPAISDRDALRDLMDIVKGMLGPQVCAQGILVLGIYLQIILILSAKIPHS